MNQKIILISIALVLIFFTTLQVLLMTHTWNPSWNPFRSSPEQIIALSFANLSEAQTMHTKFVGSVSFRNESEDLSRYSLSVEGDSDMTDSENPRGEGSLTFKASLEGIDISLGMEYKLIQDVIYVRFTTIPSFSLLTLLDPTNKLGEIKNQWIKVDLEELAEYSGDESFLKTQEKLREQQQALNEKFIEAVKNGQVYVVKSKLPEEKINGQSMYHYMLDLKTAEILRLYSGYLKEQTDESLSFEQREVFENQIEEAVEKIGDIPIEIWIGKKDNMPHRLRIAKEFSSDFLQGTFYATEDTNLFLEVEIELSRFNETINVEIPQETRSFQEVIEDTLGQSLSASQSSARDARRQADIRQIATAMELYALEHGQYLSSSIMPTSIGEFMPSSFVLTDPGGGVCADYQWISNISNPQSFCVYACLEDDEFFMASSRGTSRLPVPPPNLAACES